MSGAFEQLHPSLQQWVWGQGWATLRDIQAKAIPAVIAREGDVIIAAPTAGGKTEAAFLPVLSDIATQEGSGLRCLYIAPLRALINDQFRRLESMCESAGLRVQPWHGDISRGKKAFWKSPADVLLITPESLEAMFVIHGHELGQITRTLRYIVIDELHAFLDSARGRQLQSLLDRLCWQRADFLPRIALSATLGDFRIAECFLRPHREAAPCTTIADRGGHGEIRLQVKVLLRGEWTPPPAAMNSASEPAGAETLVAEDLFRRLRGRSNLIFANSRQMVEVIADKLRETSERERAPLEFFPHHSALSRELRESVEDRLRAGTPPTTAVCTSTLELGIDIGDVASIAQIGAPSSVASLKQRLGRSGRRQGTAQVLRQFVISHAVDAESAPVDRLRIELVQTIATIELMLRGVFEPGIPGDLHLSTLVQQVLSTTYQTGGIRAAEVYERLCIRGPFVAIDKSMFADVLRSLGAEHVLEQAPDGTLLPGRIGERVAEHYSFYAAFRSPDEYRIVCDGRLLGTIPVDTPMVSGAMLIFGGRRWAILAVDDATRTATVTPAAGGAPPRFGGTGRRVGTTVREEMRRVLAGSSTPAYLDETAIRELEAARIEYSQFGLDRETVIQHAGDAWLIFWSGDRVMDTLWLALRARGMDSARVGPFVVFFSTEKALVLQSIADLARNFPRDPVALATNVQNLLEEKHDVFLTRELLQRAFAARHLDLDGLRHALGP